MEKILEKDTKTNIALQINGKTRSVIQVVKNMEQNDVLNIAKKDIKINKYLENNIIKKEIYVPNKIVNFVL